MSHFVCQGSCGGVSDKAGTCKDPKCEKSGQDLSACTCTDPRHTEKEPPFPVEEEREEG